MLYGINGIFPNGGGNYTNTNSKYHRFAFKSLLLTFNLLARPFLKDIFLFVFFLPPPVLP